MKKINNTIKTLAAVLVSMGVTSCSLNMLPLNDVVLENYWTNESDVKSVVTSCYAGLKENGYISDMITWGEVRSDNVEEGPDASTAMRNLLKGNLKSTSPACNWSAMYTVINRCNTVIHYAPQVAEEDPNYTTSELNINLAECKALRALSYLTLIKAFRDVPFTFEPSKDDNQEYLLSATKFEDVLDALIEDIEGCKNDVPIQYSLPIYNTAKITRAAMYSLLAELYLWRASDYKLTPAEQNRYYAECIKACDKVIEIKQNQYNANSYLLYTGSTIVLSDNVDAEVLKLGYPLLSERKGTTGSGAPYAFNAIFGTGNSYESIFEISFHRDASSSEVNSDLLNMYGTQTSAGAKVQTLVASENLLPTGSEMKSATTYSDERLFSVSTDYRSVTSFHYAETDKYPIYKYTVYPLSLKEQNSYTFSYPEQVNSFRSVNSRDAGWIVYRLTEIMLFRAEAEIEMAANLTEIAEAEDEQSEQENGDEQTENPNGNQSESAQANTRRASAVMGATLTTPEELYDDAFNIITAVYLRSNPGAADDKTPTAKPKRDNYKTYDAFATLLMNERHREFLFEGKRYFDLVRQARREGNTKKFAEALTSKFGQASRAVIIKMAMMDFMYMPIAKTQIQVNPNLVQNPAYAEEESVKNN